MSNRAIIEIELTQGVVPIGTPKAYQYDQALVESAVATVLQGLAELGEYTEEKKSEYLNYATTILQAIQNQYGYPFVASTVSAMTDTTKIYVYTGSETGYTAGNWYYYDGSAWVSGGVFNSTESGVKAEMSLFGIDDLLWDNTNPASKTQNGVTFTVDKINKTVTISTGENASTGTAILTFFATGSIPAWLQLNKKYYVHMYTDTAAYLRVSRKINGSWNYTFTTKGVSELILDSSVTDISIEIVVTSGNTINTVVRPFISESLTLDETSADAKAEMAMFGVQDFLWSEPPLDAGGITSAGVTYNADFINKTITMSGTSNGGGFYRFFRDKTSLPSWLVKGKRYVAHMDSNSNARLQLYWYDASEVETYVVDDVGDMVFVIPNEAVGLGLRIYVPNGDAVNTTVRPFIYEYTTFQKIKENLVNNSEFVLDAFANVAETTSRGITYSLIDGVITMQGTVDDSATTPFNWNFYNHLEDVPSWVEAGKTFYLQLGQNGNNIVPVRVGLYGASKLFLGNIFNSPLDGSFTFPTDMSAVRGIAIKFNLPVGTEVDCTLIPKVLSAPPNSVINSALYERYTKVRIMQYNMGRFNMGKPVNDPLQFIDQTNYEQKVINCRKFYGKYQADIIGCEEFVNTKDVYTDGDISKPVYATINQNTAIFNRLYPYSAVPSNNSTPAVKSKYRIVDKTYLSIPYTYEYDGSTLSATVYGEFCHIEVEGKSVAILSTHNVSGVGAENIAKRKGSTAALLSILADEDYAFLVCDLNAGGSQYGDNSYSIAETTDLYNDVIVPAGFEMAFGMYFPWQTTWKSVTSPSIVSVLDNIIYKNNGKILLSNFEVITEEYDDLISDHYPVYGDFILL